MGTRISLRKRRWWPVPPRHDNGIDGARSDSRRRRYTPVNGRVRVSVLATAGPQSAERIFAYVPQQPDTAPLSPGAIARSLSLPIELFQLLRTLAATTRQVRRQSTLQRT